MSSSSFPSLHHHKKHRCQCHRHHSHDPKISLLLKLISDQVNENHNRCKMKCRTSLRGWLLSTAKHPLCWNHTEHWECSKWSSTECWETLNAKNIDSRSEQSPSNPDRSTTSKATQLLEQNSSNLDNGTPIWANRDIEELLNYSVQVLWEPNLDSDADNEVAKLSSTTIKIVEDAFLHSLPTGHKEKTASPRYILHKMPKTGHHYPFEIAKDCQKFRSQHGQTTDPHTWCSIPWSIY